MNLTAAKLDRGLHSGWIVATGPDGVVTHTAVGALRQGPKHKVTLRAVGLDGQPTGVPVVSLYGDNSRSDVLAWIPDGETYTAEVEEGTYLLHSLVENYDPQDEQVSLFTDPNIVVTKDTEVVIDARKAAPITIETPKPSEQQAVLSYYVHRVYGNGRVHQPRRDALQHGQAGERDADQAGQGRQLRVLVPLAAGRADGPGLVVRGRPGRSTSTCCTSRRRTKARSGSRSCTRTPR